MSSMTPMNSGGRTTVVEQAEVALLQASDEASLLVRDGEDKVDQVGADVERERLTLGGGLLRLLGRGAGLILRGRR